MLGKSSDADVAWIAAEPKRSWGKLVGAGAYALLLCAGASAVGARLAGVVAPQFNRLEQTSWSRQWTLTDCGESCIQTQTTMGPVLKDATFAMTSLYCSYTGWTPERLIMVFELLVKLDEYSDRLESYMDLVATIEARWNERLQECAEWLVASSRRRTGKRWNDAWDECLEQARDQLNRLIDSIRGIRFLITSYRAQLEGHTRATAGF